ncbi:MAG: hypothetical protein E6I91_03235 [Chloroflexi bacterium]|nr:MAG: hypothetical protein E6I91_03235 [Chloroflexota bacterium]
MSYTQIDTLVLIIQIIVSFVVAVRAMRLYTRTGGDHLFILALSMAIISVVGVIGLLNDNFVHTLSTRWFRYIAQITSFFFIFLSTLRPPSKYLRLIKRWQLISVGLLVVLLALTPVVPQLANPHVEAVVNFGRASMCFVIFLNYATIFMSKETRFSFLMALAFFLICFGFGTITPWYLMKSQLLLVYVGHSMRALGLISLFVAFLIG